MYSFLITETTLTNEQCKAENAKQRFLQTPFWADFKAAHGWTQKNFSVSVSNESLSNQSFSVNVLIRSFGKGPVRFSLAYIPMMMELPLSEKTPDEQVAEITAYHEDFSAAIKKFLPSNTICIRFDPPYDFYTCEERDFFVNSMKCYVFGERKKLCKANVDIQPPDTVLLDITKTPDELLSSMRNKWRYNIHYAEKHGVNVKAYHAGDEGFDDAVDTFYSLDEATSKRDGNAIHSKSYYKNLLELSASQKDKDAPVVTLYVASNEEDKLAAIITLFSKREAVYLFGASGNVKRNLMPAYLLQWTAINDAKTFGSPVYDFYGMPPTEDKNHPMYGLYLFKTGFGGQIVHRAGSFDMPLSPLYKLYTSAESLRAFWHKKVLKKIRGR